MSKNVSVYIKKELFVISLSKSGDLRMVKFYK